MYTDNLYRQIWLSFFSRLSHLFLIQIANAYEYLVLFSPFVLQCTRMTNFFLRLCLDAFGSPNSNRSVSRMWLRAEFRPEFRCDYVFYVQSILSTKRPQCSGKRRARSNTKPIHRFPSIHSSCYPRAVSAVTAPLTNERVVNVRHVG